MGRAGGSSRQQSTHDWALNCFMISRKLQGAGARPTVRNSRQAHPVRRQCAGSLAGHGGADGCHKGLHSPAGTIKSVNIQNLLREPKTSTQCTMAAAGGSGTPRPWGCQAYLS